MGTLLLSKGMFCLAALHEKVWERYYYQRANKYLIFGFFGVFCIISSNVLGLGT